MKFALVSAANAGFAPLLAGLVRSVRERPKGRAVPFFVFDCGLEPGQRDWLAARNVGLLQPGDEFGLKKPAPVHVRALIVRPFLPRYVPGFDALLWLDADAWVQDWHAVELHLKALETHDIAATPEVDRGYSVFVGVTPAERAQPVTAWWRGVCHQFYGDGADGPWVEQPIVNAGVFAARSGSAFWDLWRDEMARALERSEEFYVDQVAFCRLLATATDLRFARLPSACNWLCNRALPVTCRQGVTLFAPDFPYPKLGIVHLTAGTKNGEWDTATFEGRPVRVSLRYGQRSPLPDTNDKGLAASS